MRSTVLVVRVPSTWPKRTLIEYSGSVVVVVVPPPVPEGALEPELDPESLLLEALEALAAFAALAALTLAALIFARAALAFLESAAGANGSLASPSTRRRVSAVACSSAAETNVAGRPASALAACAFAGATVTSGFLAS